MTTMTLGDYQFTSTDSTRLFILNSFIWLNENCKYEKWTADLFPGGFVSSIWEWEMVKIIVKSLNVILFRLLQCHEIFYWTFKILFDELFRRFMTTTQPFFFNSPRRTFPSPSSHLDPSTAPRQKLFFLLFMSAHQRCIICSSFEDVREEEKISLKGAKWTDLSTRTTWQGEKGEEEESNQQTKWKVIYEISLFNRRQPLKWQKKIVKGTTQSTAASKNSMNIEIEWQEMRRKREGKERKFLESNKSFLALLLHSLEMACSNFYVQYIAAKDHLINNIVFINDKNSTHSASDILQ